MTKIEKVLLAKGIRPTEMRLKIYKYLKRKTYALTLNEMQNVFVIKSEKNKTANKSTFYRAIKLFEEKHMVHQINDGTAIAKYAVSDENTTGKYGTDLHMHFHCTDCWKTICLPNKISEESLPDSYKTTDVNLVLKGICKKCIRK
ncbi:Fur family ferric uptake transcriptional regulator [Gillisia mitskevichiae]|uniref:Fur family ferric uptake transcriptional regulator n=1 Tax=Gillisia mitskevichiae TaxID=270921 RepID=A0A495PZR4_9FLAO|nr:transcriptional repressor [Gillisia mitskevichiae]RKS56018.1 Fur family ferric uptake transcriptional regulator [Gillisia mitskevichiae]